VRASRAGKRKKYSPLTLTVIHTQETSDFQSGYEAGGMGLGGQIYEWRQP
jgi:hypothetical protein